MLAVINNAKIMVDTCDDSLHIKIGDKCMPVGTGGPGSGGGIPTAIIKQDGYDNALMGVAVAGSSAPTFTCTNMTYEEAKNVILSGQPLSVVVMVFQQDGSYTSFATGYYYSVVFSILEDGSESIVTYGNVGENLMWTSYGITMDLPK